MACNNEHESGQHMIVPLTLLINSLPIFEELAGSELLPDRSDGVSKYTVLVPLACRSNVIHDFLIFRIPLQQVMQRKNRMFSQI